MASVRILVNETRPWSVKTITAAGEELVKETAHSLSKRGHKVSVYRAGGEERWGGVDFYPRERFIPQEYSDVVLIRKDSEALKDPINTLYLGYWTDEIDAREKLAPYRGIYNDVICISQWQNKTYFNGRAKVVPLGLKDEFGGGKKEEYSVLYASSPDRGLDILLNAWEEVKKEVPKAKLYVTYLKYSEKEMVELYKKCDIWAYPCTGIEMYCQTAAKAQKAGCVPVVIPHMALEETVKVGVLTSRERFSIDLIETLKNKRLKSTIRERLAKIRFPSWDDSAKELEKLWLPYTGLNQDTYTTN